MISWKNPFERLNEEYELTQKKKEALDKLYDDGKISQSTYDSFNKKIDEAIADIERQQRALLEKMNSKAEELEKHVKTLETLLADFEIRHVTGEIEEEVYQREIDLLSIGLETARQELDGVKGAIDELSSGIPIQPTGIDAPEEAEIQTTEPQTPENIESMAEVVDETQQVVEIEKIPDEIEQPTLPEPPEDAAEEDMEETIGQLQESQENTEMEPLDTQEDTEEALQNTEETWTDIEEDEETTQSMEEEELSEEEDEEITESMDEEIEQKW